MSYVKLVLILPLCGRITCPLSACEAASVEEKAALIKWIRLHLPLWVACITGLLFTTKFTIMHDFDAMTTSQLRKQQHWHDTALKVVVLGITFALFAICYAYIKEGVFPLALLITCCFAAALAYPVYLQRNKVVRLLKTRI